MLISWKLGRQHGTIDSQSGYALALTTSHAIVWPYAINAASPETFTFALPNPSKHTSDPLPLGSLVSPSASTSDPGLVVVMPVSGKITYWESIASAATLDLIQQQRKGIEYSIPGMFHSETVIQILNAETAGFILSFSSGRLAYMSVRDGQGRPAISVQFLRGTSGPGSGGIFGSIRNALSSSSWRGNLAAARAGPSSGPGERDVVTASSKGRLQAWSLHRGGHNSLEAEGDARESVVDELKRTDVSLSGLDLESFEIIDFSFAPQAGDRANAASLTYRDDNGTELLLLTSLSGQGLCHYALVQVFLRPNAIDVGAVRHIRTYSTPISRGCTSKPRLYLPNPGVVAFIIFERAVVITSMANEPDSPEAQLLADSHGGLRTFEDVVDFRSDAGVEITGSGMEEPSSSSHHADESRSKRHKAKYPAVVLLVKGDGVIRVAITNPQKFTSAEAPQVTAKSKLEQAVFFGALENNPLSFAGRSEIQFTSEEVGAAALSLSREILSSTTPHIPSIPASIEQNLRIRAEALNNLAKHLKEMQVDLDRATKWKLLWNAEKLSGAAAAWENYDTLVSSKPEGQKRSLWNDIVLFLHESIKSVPSAELGEVDRVRHYFIHDIYRFELVVPWGFQAVKYKHQDEHLSQPQIVSLISEANDLVIGALKGAYQFRLTHLELYGLQTEPVENGILTGSGYRGLPEPWTCKAHIADHVRRQTDLAISLVKEFYPLRSGEGLPDPDLIEKIRLEIPDLLDLSCRSNTEKYSWFLGQDDKKLYDQGLQLMNAHLKGREIQIYNLWEIGLVDEAIALAQRHRVLHALVALVVEDLQRSQDLVIELGGEKHEDAREAKKRRDRDQALVRRYYDLFGRDWAEALYLYYIKRNELFALITDNEGHEAYLTEFLRSKKIYTKLAWINEVRQEKNFDRAAKELLDLGLRRERDLWTKKVELSIGKLARLAGRQYSETGGLIIPDGGHAELAETKKELALIQIQEKIYNHVRSAVRAAIDEMAERQLALEVYGNEGLKGKAGLSTVLHEKLGWLLDHKAMGALDLVDLLTLIGPNNKSEDAGLISGQEFYYALEALKAGGPQDKDELNLTEKVIWRRCFLRDNWAELNNTDLKGDDQVRWQLERTALYSTLRACIKNRKSA